MYLEEKLDLLLKQNEELKSYIELFIPDLTTDKGVIHFLEITRNTFNTYINNNTFIEGSHYIKEGKKRVFLSSEIVKLKKLGIKGKRNKSIKQISIEIAKEKLGIMSSSRSATKGIS